MKKKKLYGNTLKEQLKASTRDQLYNFVLAEGTIRGVVVNGTRMVNEMRWNHELGILETLALGHGYLGAALMSASLKGNDRLSMKIECSGPIKGMSVDANAFGELRGYLKQVPIPIDKPVERFDLSPFFGAGFLSVTKYLEDAKQPFTGKIMMAYGRVAKDLALYHLKSEQVPTAFNLSILFDKAGQVTGAGGLMLQVLPGADEDVLTGLEQQLQEMPSIGGSVHDEDFPVSWLDEHFSTNTPRLLGHRGVEFMCHCNQKRIAVMLAMLKPEDIREMAENGPFPIQIRCHNCNTSHDFSRKEIRAIQKMQEAKK